MPRQCAEYHADPSQTEQVCWLCWLDIHDASYREFWANGKTVARALPVLDCIHRSKEPTGEVEGCLTCKGNRTLKVYTCAVYGTCTIGTPFAGRGCCSTACKDRAT